MESTWGRQDPGGPHVGPMNFDIWESSLVLHVTKNSSSIKQSFKHLAKNYNTRCQSGFQWTFKQIEPREQFQRRKGFIDLCPWYIFRIWPSRATVPLLRYAPLTWNTNDPFHFINIVIIFRSIGLAHRENGPVTQTTPEPTLLIWGGWPREKKFPHPWLHCQTRSYRAYRAT